MSTHPIGEIAGGDPRTTALRQMTPEQLLHLGTRQVAYLRTSICDGQVAFVLFGADGEPLVIAGDIETAVKIAADHGLAFATIH